MYLAAVIVGLIVIGLIVLSCFTSRSDWSFFLGVWVSLFIIIEIGIVSNIIGEPKHDGTYIVTSFDPLQKINICRVLERVGYKWMNDSLEVRCYNIKAWCKLSDIEPYKE